MSKEINAVTGLLVIEVVNSNPNGDPNCNGDPRTFDHNDVGIISPVSFKSKLRELIRNSDGPVFSYIREKLKISSDNFEILESRYRDRGTIIKEMGAEKNKKFNQKEFSDSVFVKKYWDARIFGNTFLEKELAKFFIKTGVVQFSIGTSVSPVQINRLTYTNYAGVENEKNQGMAPDGFCFVNHGVYYMPFVINPTYVHKTGCTAQDIEVLKMVIPYAYDHTCSSIRTDVRIRHAWYIEHKNPRGSCARHLLIESLKPKRKDKNMIMEPSTSWDDYEVPNELPEDLLSKVNSCEDLINDTCS